MHSWRCCSKLFDQATQVKNSISFKEDESWQLSNGQIFVILVTFFIVVFLIILCCAARRKRKPQERNVLSQPAPAPYQSASMCPSCHNTIHSMSQLTVAEDPYPPTYDSIYSTAQSRAMFLNHDQNRHNGPPPSAPPATDLH
jgi:hypothetical protein